MVLSNKNMEMTNSITCHPFFLSSLWCILTAERQNGIQMFVCDDEIWKDYKYIYLLSRVITLFFTSFMILYRLK